MREIFYVDSNVLTKTAREKFSPYTMVGVIEKLPYNKVKVYTYCFDIPCAYYASNRIGSDIIEEDKIKTLNWDTILNDLKKGTCNRKYWYWWFLNKAYKCDSLYADWNSTVLRIYWDGKIIDTLDTSKLNEEHPWCKNQHVLVETEIVLNYMIQNNIDKDNASKLLEIIHCDDVTITTEESLREKKLIK